MIFMMSKRVYLNYMCPLMDKDVLLNANYYIADVRSPNRIRDSVQPENEYELVNGEWVCKADKPVVKKATTYNIQYGSDCLNPAPYVTTLLNDSRDHRPFDVRMIETLSAFHNMRSIYEEIYMPTRRGNGLLFILYFDDDNIKTFGHIIAQHLALCFGEDVTFVDPKVRPYVRGQYQYPAKNPEYAAKVKHDLKEYIMYVDFLQSVNQCGDIEGSVNNMTTYLLKHEFKDLTRLYEILWPDDPLPPDNYTCDDVREIIVSKMVDCSGRINVNNQNINRLNVLEIYNP